MIPGGGNLSLQGSQSPDEIPGDDQNRLSTFKEKGKLGIHSVKKYPGFGEEVSQKKEYSWIKIAQRIGVIGIFILGAAVVGFLVGNVPGALIGGGIVAGLVVTAALCKVIYEKMNGYRLLMQLPEEGQRNIHEPEPYKLGQYYDSDLRLTATADEGFEWKKKLIESAEETIELSANFAGGSSFQEILQLIDEKMTKNSHIKTHMIISVDLLEKKDDSKLVELKKKFGKRFRILRTDRHFKLDVKPYTEENHVKMLIVDGKYFVSGGTGIHPQISREDGGNLEKENSTFTAKLLGNSARDMDIVGESVPLSSVMRKQFFNLYRLWEIRTKNKIVENRYFIPNGTQGHCQKFSEEKGLLKDVRLKFITGGPEHRGNNPIVREYSERITKAKKEVRLANLLFNPPKAIKKALIDARAESNKKKIVGYINGERTGFSIWNLIQVIPSHSHYELLDKMYEYTVPDQLYHKKVATFDDTHTMIGSFNLGKKSAKFDHEVAFVIKDKRVATLCKQILKEDAKRSVKVSRAQIVQNHFWAKIAASIISPFVENFT